MAEVLEETTPLDTDRKLDGNGFLNEQFDIFTHDFREFSEAPKCTDHAADGACCSKEPDELPKKEIVNITRKLQKAIFSIKSMPGHGPIIEMLQALEDVNEQIMAGLRQEGAEFSTTTVSLPDFDPTDMQLLLGKDEIPDTLSMLDRVGGERKKTAEKLRSLVQQADILLTEVQHMKQQLAGQKVI